MLLCYVMLCYVHVMLCYGMLWLVVHVTPLCPCCIIYGDGLRERFFLSANPLLLSTFQHLKDVLLVKRSSVLLVYWLVVRCELAHADHVLSCIIIGLSLLAVVL